MVSCGAPGCTNRAVKAFNINIHHLPWKSKTELRINNLQIDTLI